MLLELVEILQEYDEPIIVPIKADDRDRKRESRQKWERKHPKRAKRRRGSETPAQKAARLRHEKLHLMVSRIVVAADKANNEGRGFTTQAELTNFLAQEGVVGSHRHKGALASHFERMEIKETLTFGESISDIQVLLLPDGLRILIAQVSNPQTALTCRCRLDRCA